MNPLRVVSISGGKDSTATLLLALENNWDGGVRAVTADTGHEHPRVIGGPERIWLVYGEPDEEVEHKHCDEVCWCSEPQFPNDVPYIREADHLAALTAERERADRAEADLERERMQLAACSVVALANTAETAAEARDMHPDYDSASVRDVAAAVDREMALRERLARLVGAAKEVLRISDRKHDAWDALRAELGDK